MSVLRVREIHKTFQENSVVKQLSFEIKQGECYGLLGPNGAGKTTTLRLCLGLTAPDAGQIELLGLSIPAQAELARARVGVVPQADSLDPDFTVTENLLVFGRYFGMSNATIRARIPQLLEFANLTSKANARINELSGGMKRRLTLARALVNDPDFIVLDEPTTGLDPQARHMIWERLKNLLAQGKTILLTTHFMDEAERLCDRLMVLDHGQKITEGPPRSLIAEHIEPHVLELYGEGATAWASAHHPLAERVEQSGETAFLYTAHPEQLIEKLQTSQGLRYMHRPANLEDVFLKLTGREIRD